MTGEIKGKGPLKLHPRNKNRKRYDLKAMAEAMPELTEYIQPNKRGGDSINFADPKAVRMLNKAILQHYYGVEYWEFPKANLCPPIPGRADYIHHIADLLGTFHRGKSPTGANVTCVDIGTGASAIYPIIGITEYQWNFIASDIDPVSIQSARQIIHANPSLRGKVRFKLQQKPRFIFRGVLDKKDPVDVTICNPPFHSSREEALKSARRKVRKLSGQKTDAPTLNFAGVEHELVCQGGELQFIKNMIVESTEFARSCFWFSTLVSKESNLRPIYKMLKKKKVTDVRTIPIRTGNKASRIVAWTFFTPEAIQEWQASKSSESETKA